MNRRSARFHAEKKKTNLSKQHIASSIHDVKFYGTVVQSKQNMEMEMILSEVSVLRIIAGIHIKDQGNSLEIDKRVWKELQLEESQPDAHIVQS